MQFNQSYDLFTLRFHIFLADSYRSSAGVIRSPRILFFKASINSVERDLVAPSLDVIESVLIANPLSYLRFRMNCSYTFQGKTPVEKINSCDGSLPSSLLVFGPLD